MSDKYWEYLTKRSDFESLEANPDRLSTEDAVWNTQQEEDEKEKIESFRLAFKHLSSLEQKIVFITAVQGKSVPCAARELGLTPEFVRKRLAHAKGLIRKFHAERVKDEI